MPVSSQSRSGSLAETLKTERQTNSDLIRVALPGIIQSFDPDTVTAIVQPAVKFVQQNTDGSTSTHNYPLLTHVPVIFPRGGGCTLTFPVKEGDECLVIFGDRCIDFWWQNGGIQEPVDQRQHDLSDGFAIVGPQSQAKKISGISTTAAQLRTDDGGAVIELDPASHAVNLTTIGKLTATAEETTINGPAIFNGPVTFNSTVTQPPGKGAASFGEDVTAGGISLKEHIHGGVQTGGGNTEKPQ